MISNPRPLTAPLRALAEPIRLRILGLLEREELNVGELGRALELAQSRVSNHLRVLREEGFLAERHVGSSTFLRAGLEPGDSAALGARLWSALRGELARLPEHAGDLARLEGVLAERRASQRDFFDEVAGRWDKLGARFASGVAREQAAAALLPASLVLADLGCGTGWFARALLPRAARLVLVDSSSAMLDEALQSLGPLPSGTRVDPRQGELESLPLEDGELDGLVCGLVLHHLPDLAAPAAEMRRVLRPGGTAVIVELAPHREAWMHDALGDRHLGLDPRDVVRTLERAGFVDVRLEAVPDRYRPRRPDRPESSPDEAGADLSLYAVRARAPGGSALP